MKQRLVVIGNGMAGMRTVEELLCAAPDQYDITVFGAEPYGNYNRIMLSGVLSGEKALPDIVINNRQWYAANGINLQTGTDKEVVKIERSRRSVLTRDGSRAEYDKLLIATGAKPVIAAVPGHDLAGVISFRDIADVSTMLNYSRTHQHAVVLGGGLLGLEAANGLALRGMDVTVIHNHAVLMNRQLDNQAGRMLQTALEQRGVRFCMTSQVQALLGNQQQHIRAVRCEDGRELACDLLVMAIGIRPNISLAQQAGLFCQRGIVVNDTLQSYDPRIYAVGECIQHRDTTFGLVAPLFAQASVCANHLSGHGVARFVQVPTATKLKVSGINLFSAGDFSGGQQTRQICYQDPERAIYKNLLLKDNRLVGAVLYGDTEDGPWYQHLLESGEDISARRDALIFGKAYADRAIVRH
ncbi:NAD(P)/FAD-dependent oxidoreductase [Methylomonas paludis]|uniref:NAD(P)/FAD-dependent oxidoreductase n=1 Tax=Methylomonas paludis TaxID=1173101 RepID=A0A975MM04_9GAMM|nr:FAD-dependent oxidoreductase [Methylomonas paludis]QWF70079.1 NAD(P)/FAD-dependent oxidoreductase [Methylomonas paludis]